MKNPSPSLAAWAVITVSCIAWVAGICSAMVYFFGLSSDTGWIIAAILGVPVSFAIGVIIYEVGHAVDLSNYIDPSEFNGFRPKLPATPVSSKSAGSLLGAVG